MGGRGAGDSGGRRLVVGASLDAMTSSKAKRRSRRVARGYDRLAPWYERIERLRFGSRLHRWRSRWIDELPADCPTLLLGDGDGRLLASLLESRDRRAGMETGVRPAPRIVSIDISAAMLAVQRLRIASYRLADAVEFRRADLREVDLGRERFGLIVAAFCLDAFAPNELRRLSRQIAGALEEGGLLYVVDFCVPTLGWRRWWARFWLFVMHAFFRCCAGHPTWRLVPRDDVLGEAGFQVVRRSRDAVGWIEATLWQRTDAAVPPVHSG
jgi:SAM-dependent methyltransferase